VDIMTTYSAIPASILLAIDRFVQHGLMPGGFVMSCLENDLRGAVTRAEEGSLTALLPIVQFLNMEIPSPAWGSRSAVDSWAARGGYFGQHQRECWYESDEASVMIDAAKETK
jgi:hypothetical protein